MYAQTMLLLTGRVVWTHGLAFVFFGTLSLYALHRVIGLRKVMAFADKGRYKVIYEHRSHIVLYGLVAMVAGAWHFFQLPQKMQLWILPAALLAGAYVLPLGKGGRRLRDFGAIKIFMIALVFAWLTVWLPALEAGMQGHIATWIMLPERFAFLFAITVPFDIRDREVDLRNDVRTLPVLMGERTSLWLAEGALGLVAVCVALNALIGCYPEGVVIGMAVSVATTAWWVWLSPKKTHDYYFTGLLDGTMLLQFLLVQAGWHLS